MLDPLCEPQCEWGECILDDIVFVDEGPLFVNSEMQQQEEVAIRVEDSPYSVTLLELPVDTTEYHVFLIGQLTLLPEDGIAHEICGIGVPAAKPSLVVEYPQVVVLVVKRGQHLYSDYFGMEGMPAVECDILVQ